MFLQKYVGEIPKVNKPEKYKKLQLIIDDFITMQTKIATVTFESDEYANAISGYRSLVKACAISCKPVKAVFRQEAIFLVRTDM